MAATGTGTDSPSGADSGWLAEQATEARREREAEAGEAAAWSNASSGPAIDGVDALRCEVIAAQHEAIEQQRLTPDPPEAPPRLTPGPQAAIAARAAELLAEAHANPAISITDEAKAAAYFRGRAIAELPLPDPPSHEAQRPPSWTNPDDAPRLGDRCRSCRGGSWWTESTTPRGWRCRVCHPPAAPFVKTVRT
jgi:hypothetical protein